MPQADILCQNITGHNTAFTHETLSGGGYTSQDLIIILN